MIKPYVRNADLPVLEKFLKKHKAVLWDGEPPYGDDREELFWRGVKAAMILTDWQNEVSDTMISERYGVGPGDVYAMVEGVNWLLHATVQLARLFRPAFYPQVRECEICVKHGIKRELLPLVRLRGIGRVRARRLFDRGITDPDQIRKAGKEDITNVLGKGIADQVFAQLNGNDVRAELEAADPPAVQPTLFSFGKEEEDA